MTNEEIARICSINWRECGEFCERCERIRKALDDKDAEIERLTKLVDIKHEKCDEAFIAHIKEIENMKDKLKLQEKLNWDAHEAHNETGKKLQTLRTCLEEVRKSLEIISESPGGGPGKRIALQALKKIGDTLGSN